MASMTACLRVSELPADFAYQNRLLICQKCLLICMERMDGSSLKSTLRRLFFFFHQRRMYVARASKSGRPDCYSALAFPVAL